MTADFIELGITTNFSFLKGASHGSELVLTALALGYEAMGVADANTLAGVVRVHGPAKEHGLRPIIGCRLDLMDAPSMLAYPKDRAGYGQLCELLSAGKMVADKGACHLMLEDVAAYQDGLILIALPQPNLAEHLPRMVPQLRSLTHIAASMTYTGDDIAKVTRLDRLARNHDLTLLATNDVLYHTPARRPLQDVMTCIREKTTLTEAGYLLQANGERHLKSPYEMMRLFSRWPHALRASVEIAEAIDFSLDELRYEYPQEVVPEGMTASEHLRDLTYRGAARRYPAGVPKKVEVQVEKELALIEKMDIPQYFLTVHDIVAFARGLPNPILCQGRGSAANSAVCYCLGITAVDPASTSLLFERFISESRKEPPDIDVDFEHERREEVIQHIYERYGRNRAGLAATVIHYRPRMAIREVGKVMGLSEDVTAEIAKTAWGSWGSTLHLEQAKEAGLDLSDPHLKRAMKLADELIGQPRHLSQHVGGFILTQDRLTSTVPIGNAAMDDRTFIEWDKDDIEELGILKVDVLALGMLTCIAKAFDMLSQIYGHDYDLATIPEDDQATYDMLCRGDSLGVFQVESRAQMSMLPRMKPRCFYDLVIEVAIVRPGPIQGDMVHPYLRRRDGLEEVEYPSPAPDHGPADELRKILGRTLGVPIFQEQAMQIAIDAAKFSGDEANQLRKAMATFRSRGQIDAHQDRMVKKMTARGYDEAFAMRCFSQIRGFGEYGFPESHAASFAHLVYVSSWIKCHYPDVFCAALLNSQPMGFYAPAQIVRDAREHGVTVLPVDVNISEWDNFLEPAVDTRAEAQNYMPPRRPPTPPNATPPLASLDLTQSGLIRGLPQNEATTSKAVSVEHSRNNPLPDPPPERGREDAAKALPRSGGGLGGGSSKIDGRGLGPDVSNISDKDPGSSPGKRMGLSPCPRPTRRGLVPSDVPQVDPALASSPGRQRIFCPVRLGLRQVDGISEETARTLEAARDMPFTDMTDFHERTRLPVHLIEKLAAADAFRSIGLDRRQALWQVRQLKDAPDLPLFSHVDERADGPDAHTDLPEMPLPEHVVADYQTLRLSLKAHPVQFLRERYTAMGAVPCQSLYEMKSGTRSAAAGVVLVRQRPGTAKGVVFITIEDETGVANVIVWPKMLERYRKLVMTARLLFVKGQVQSAHGVTHLVAHELIDCTADLDRLTHDDTEVHPQLSRADEITRPLPHGTRDRPANNAQSAGRTHPRNVRVIPKSRDFH